MRTIALVWALSGIVFAQDLTHKAPAQKGRIAIIDAKLMGGPQGYVLFDKGLIVAAREGEVKLAGEWTVVDAGGKSVYPGFIGSYTHLGLVEIGAVRASRDLDETGEVTPEARAAVAVNPDSTLIPVARSNGVLTFATFPRGGAIPGRASVMSMDGWTWEDMAVRADAGLVVNWPHPNPPPPPERRRRREPRGLRGSKRLRLIEETFEAARAYLDARAADESIPEDIRYDSPTTTRRSPARWTSRGSGS